MGNNQVQKQFNFHMMQVSVRTDVRATLENGLVAFIRKICTYNATRKPSCVGILYNKMETYVHMKLCTGMKPAVFLIAKKGSNPSIHQQSMGAMTHSDPE